MAPLIKENMPQQDPQVKSGGDSLKKNLNFETLPDNFLITFYLKNRKKKYKLNYKFDFF